ncbi:MAG TPA: hypothetical protein VED67_00505 [Thermodesulfovibrionales bacterium]|nr:hypothetical protein [Thermodesulfovibrionales bacterium]
MKRYLFVVLLSSFALWFLSGCTTAVRYSPEEIKDYPPDIQEEIRQGNVSAGMTTQQVRYAWGAPATVNILAPSQEGKPREEWIYSSSILVTKRLLFVDGKLFDIFPAPRVKPQPSPQEQQPTQQEPQPQKSEEKK